jgi:hypothetical protein
VSTGGLEVSGKSVVFLGTWFGLLGSLYNILGSLNNILALLQHVKNRHLLLCQTIRVVVFLDIERCAIGSHMWQGFNSGSNVNPTALLECKILTLTEHCTVPADRLPLMEP